MASDFFGYNRTVGGSDEIATSEALTMTGAMGSDLLQRVSLQYGQNIRTLFAVGNSNIYFVGGQAQGTLDFERMSKCGSMLEGMGGDCGKIGQVGLAGAGSGGCFCAPGGVTISDALLESVSVKAQAGQVEVLEGGRIRFGSLS